MPPLASFFPLYVGLQISCIGFRVAVLVGEDGFFSIRDKVRQNPAQIEPPKEGSFGGFECSSDLKKGVPFLNQVITPSWILFTRLELSLQPHNDTQTIPRSLLLPQCSLTAHKIVGLG